MKQNKKLIIFVISILMILMSCMSDMTPAEVMGGYHTQINKGAVGMAVSYIAKDATFEIDAAPIAGGNGRLVGREEIRTWLNKVAENNGVATVFDMELDIQTLTCFLKYEDTPLDTLGLHEIELVEEAVVENGFIQSYKLTLLPVTYERLDNYNTLMYANLERIEPADRKFYMPDYTFHLEG